MGPRRSLVLLNFAGRKRGVIFVRHFKENGNTASSVIIAPSVGNGVNSLVFSVVYNVGRSIRFAAAKEGPAFGSVTYFLPPII